MRTLLMLTYPLGVKCNLPVSVIQNVLFYQPEGYLNVARTVFTSFGCFCNKMAVFYFYLLSSLLLLLYVLLQCLQRKSNLPPEINGIPVLGYLPFFKNYMHIDFRNIGKKYGWSLFSIQLGLKRVIVLNDWTSVKEALVNQTENFSGRPKTVIFNEIRERADITGSDGPLWKKRRNFTMKTMRRFGFRDVFMETIILEEVHKLLKRVRSKLHTQKMDMEDLFMNHLLNIIWGVSTGKIFEDDDERISEFAHTLKITSIQNSNSNLVEFLPFLKHVPMFNKDFNEFVKSTKKIHRYIEDEIDEHIKTYDENNIRDLVDAYLQEMYRREKMNIEPQMFQRKYLRGIMYNLFNGGVDTGNNMITWSILYMACWPKIQQKVQEEMDKTIGRGRLPTWADRTLLPYTEAVLSEIQRFSSIAPTGFPHCCYNTTKVGGYTVPKGAYVLANLWAVHNDPDYWGDPEIFRPERFLNDEGKLERPEYLIPFSTGRRSCIGENLAKMEIYLFFTSMLQSFRFSFLTGERPPSFEPIVGLTLRTKPFSLFFQERV